MQFDDFRRKHRKMMDYFLILGTYMGYIEGSHSQFFFLKQNVSEISGVLIMLHSIVLIDL